MPKPSGLYKPEKMVEHGVLAKLAEEERKDPEKDDEIKELREKAAKVRSKQEGPACQDMETYLKLARKIRKEEELAKDGKTRQGLVKFVNFLSFDFLSSEILLSHTSSFSLSLLSAYTFLFSFLFSNTFLSSLSPSNIDSPSGPFPKELGFFISL